MQETGLYANADVDVVRGSSAVDAVLHIHPSRTCNLTCRHCYSLSGPAERGALDEALVGRVLDDARALGYTRVSFSGGEPLMYAPLQRLLARAREIGMSTSVTTNGTLISRKNAEWLGNLVDVLAVSVDGIPTSHNRIRGSEHAFGWTERGLTHLQQAGSRFVTIFTLTEHNLDELPFVAALTATYGGTAVQIHPLELAGRAVDDMPGDEPGGRELAQAWFAAIRLAAAHVPENGPTTTSTDDSCQGPMSNVRLHPDIADTRLVLRRPELVLPSPSERTPRMSSVVRPLVLEQDGMVVPVTYGFARRFAIGDVTQEPLSSLAERWMNVGFYPFMRIIKQALDGLAHRSAEWPFINWYSHLANTAATLSPDVRAEVADGPTGEGWRPAPASRALVRGPSARPILIGDKAQMRVTGKPGFEPSVIGETNDSGFSAGAHEGWPSVAAGPPETYRV